MSESTRLNKSADINPCTWNPGTSDEASIIINALSTKVKSPKVSRLIGSVSSTRIGFINVLMTPKTTATISAVERSGIVTPGKIWAVTKTEIVLMMSPTINPILR